MLTRIFLFFTVFLYVINAHGQSRLELSADAGINLSKFYLEKIDVEYEDPMSANLGFSLRVHSSVELSDKMFFCLDFGYSYMDSKANKKNNRISENVDVPVYLSYSFLPRNKMHVGVIYTRLLKFSIGGWGDTIDFTSIATNRDFLNPYLAYSYRLHEHIAVKLEGIYSIRDTYLASATDFQGMETQSLKANRHSTTLTIQFFF